MATTKTKETKVSGTYFKVPDTFVFGLIENATQTGNTSEFGTGLAAVGGFLGQVERTAGGIIGGLVDIPGAADGMLNRVNNAAQAGHNYGTLVGISKFIGTAGIGEAIHGTDIATHEALDETERVNRLAEGIGASSGILRAGAGVLKFARPKTVEVPTVQHHTIPSETLKKLPKGVANHPLVRGRAGAPNRWRMPEVLHKEIHRGARGGPYNQFFREKLKFNPDPNVDDVLRWREEAVRRFRLEKFRP